ncbi:MAG TPA: dihydrolipoyl dehydrogenase [Sedimentisphaerales bacterium]|nr:dihydrolipoyl dehydrogenase [Sedimentisphaerales bacterium]
MPEQFDTVIIGSGPGGYYAAIRCAQKKKSVAIIEKEFIGGTCLNWGCIPSKALLGSAHFLTLARHAGLMGIDMTAPTPNWPKMHARKNAIIQGFRAGLTGLMKGNNIKLLEGAGKVVAPGTVKVVTKAGDVEMKSSSIIIATGSEALQIPSIPFDGNVILSNKEVLNLPAIPASMVIIGGGVIGCEMACVYATMGTKVTIVEALPRILPMQDEWISQIIVKEFKKLGITCLEGKKVTAVDKSASPAKVSLESGETIEADKVLVSVGRRAVCDQETVDALKLQMNGKLIKVNRRMQTSAPGVYAIGDVVGTTYLAHGAFAEAEIAADNIAGHPAEMGDYDLIPKAIYTFPEVASVGKSEKQCRDAGMNFTVGKSVFRSNGRSLAHNETIGEIRAIRDNTTNRVVGVTMVGAAVTELLSAARVLLGTTEDIANISFAHPTVSEVLKEAWEDAFGVSPHNLPKR